MITSISFGINFVLATSSSNELGQTLLTEFIPASRIPLLDRVIDAIASFALDQIGNSGHFQLVAQGENNAYEIEVQSSFSDASWQVLWENETETGPRPVFLEESEQVNTFGYDNSAKYAETNLIFSHNNYDNIWNQMIGVADVISDQEIPYLAITQNSNTFAMSIAWVFGVDGFHSGLPGDEYFGNMPEDVEVTPGANQNILDPTAVLPDYFINLTLVGVGDDADVFNAGLGDDRLFGNGGDDYLSGGGGENTLVGGAGKDHIALGNQYWLIDQQTGLVGLHRSPDPVAAGTVNHVYVGEGDTIEWDPNSTNHLYFTPPADAPLPLLQPGQAFQLGGAERFALYSETYPDDPYVSAYQYNLVVDIEVISEGPEGKTVVVSFYYEEVTSFTYTTDDVRTGEKFGHFTINNFDGFDWQEWPVGYDPEMVGLPGVDVPTSPDPYVPDFSGDDDSDAEPLTTEEADQVLDTDLGDLRGSIDEPIFIDLKAGDDTFESQGEWIDIINAGVGNDTVSTGGGDDLIDAGAGDDIVFAGSGDDFIIGGSGSDIIDGGDGVDTVVYTAFDGVLVYLNSTEAQEVSVGNFDIIINVENVFGSKGDDFIYGSHRSNVLFGDAGDDRLAGRGGDDVLMGGDGDDRLVGGSGADYLDGGAGIDTAAYGGSGEGVSVSLTTGTGLGGHAQGDVLVNIENVVGSAWDDILEGDDSANRLAGGAGADRLFGMAGDDRLVGGDGDDWLSGGAGSDRLLGGSGADTFFFDEFGGRDVIVDLEAGDRIVFDDSLMATFGYATEADLFASGAVVELANGNFRFNFGDDVLIVRDPLGTWNLTSLELATDFDF